MKHKLIKLGARIDALTLRERVMLFAAAAAAIVFIVHFTLLKPLFARQSALRSQISQQHDNIAGIENAITHKVQAYALDPDAPARVKLAAIQADIGQLAGALRALQKGLVGPERIAPLIETILRANGRLQLVSMKTLPTAAATPADLLYRHGVELAVRGNYLDMVNYMVALEAMPTQLLWGGARLEVEEYPNARLTLTLYTLGLERKWMKL